MPRKMRFQLIAIISVLVAAILWLLSVVVADAFGWFNFAFFVAVVSFFWGIALLIDGVSLKDKDVVGKKARIILGALLGALGVVSLVFALELKENLIVPLIIIVVSCAAIIGVFAIRGEKWDKGDNEKEGYQTYLEKKEKEKDEPSRKD